MSAANNCYARETMLLEARSFLVTDSGGVADSQVLDFRYAPIMEQACIGLPDDPYKSIVGCEKAKSNPGLYYDFGSGPYMGFQTRILASVETEGEPGQVSQRLWSPTVPIVIIDQNKGGLKFVQEVWAAVPESVDVEQWSKKRADYLWLKLKNEGDKSHKGTICLQVDSKKKLVLNEQRTGLVEKDNFKKAYCVFSDTCESVEYKPAFGIGVDLLPDIQRNWAKPVIKCANRFSHVMIGWNRPLVFNYPVAQGKKCKIAFGLIEGYHDEAGTRPLEICIEGQTVKTVDLVKDYGRNVPAVLCFDAEDRNGDGTIEFGVYPVQGAKDMTAILSGLWIFDESSKINEKEILAGRADGCAKVVTDVDNIALSQMNSIKLVFKEKMLDVGEQSQLLFKFLQGQRASSAISRERAGVEQKRAIEYWQNVNLPYGRIQVPDEQMQSLVDSCIRNIYQAREIKDNLPAFQVGPTCYRGLWVVDGAFIMETVSYLGRMDEARNGIQYLLGFQREDGAFMLIDGHWKEVGIVLWAVSRHAHLSGDRAWLESIWPKVEKGISYIESMRMMPPDEVPNAGLVPAGFSDGGLAGKYPEYTNVYWTLAGYKSAIEAAGWLGKDQQAIQWQKQYDDFYRTFYKAAQRDMRVDRLGNRFLPIRMVDDQNVPEQKAQWALLHAVFPGKIFAVDDPLVVGTMAMLRGHERQGLVQDTGWVKDGLWGYFGSFYGHAWLWRGEGGKAADTLYAFANHASPLLCWREEQNPVGGQEDYCGDMPHNWASAELIRMIRHLLILERGDELHLLEGLPTNWTGPGDITKLREIPTSFGTVSVLLEVAEDGRSATIKVDPPRRDKPEKIIIHLEHFMSPVAMLEIAGKELTGGTISIPTDQTVTLKVFFKK